VQHFEVPHLPSAVLKEVVMSCLTTEAATPGVNRTALPDLVDVPYMLSFSGPGRVRTFDFFHAI
jgi:hypothetical protein